MIDSLYSSFQRWSEKNAVFAIADLHLGESEDLRQAYSNRPTDEELVKKVNSIAGKGSTLIICGDVGTDLELIDRLRANIVLLCGNHDHLSGYYKDVVSEVYAGPLMIGEKIILSHEPIPNLTWAMNFHGHVHDPRHKNDINHFNVCADVINYEPINFNQLLKSGILSKVETLHRITIDNATAKARKRGTKRVYR